jgi:hypothetical protein
LVDIAGAPIALESYGPDANAKRWVEAHIPLDETPELDADPQRQRPVVTLQARPPQSAVEAHGLAVLHSWSERSQ